MATSKPAEDAERCGFHSVWTSEAWGSDAFTPLAWWGAATERVRLGTAVVQISARTPAACAMHALTLDHLSGGRVVLGLGVSGPQVVEGWYGRPFSRPLRTNGVLVELNCRRGSSQFVKSHHLRLTFVPQLQRCAG